MPIVIPVERRIILGDDEEFSLPLNILHSEGTTEWDETLLDIMSMYKPRTRFREGDIVMLLEVPRYLALRREVIPRLWKIRFIITAWAWDLLGHVVTHRGALSPDQAVTMLEAKKDLEDTEWRRPLIFAHGYPHGEYNNSAAWLPESYLKRTIKNEARQAWRPIVEELQAEYRGYDTTSLPTRFYLDLEPNDYKSSRSLHRPLVAEEPVVQALHTSGLGPWLEIPYISNERDKLKAIDPDHDVFSKEEE